MTHPIQQVKKGGRPTKYKPEFCQQLIDFFDTEPFTTIDIIHYQKDGKTKSWVDKKRVPNKLPTLIDFAKFISVAVRTVYGWIDKESTSYQKEFLQTLEVAREIRKWFIVQNGLCGLWNPLFAKFVSINVTDMRDKKEVELPDLANFASMIQAARKAKQIDSVTSDIAT